MKRRTGIVAAVGALALAGAAFVVPASANDATDGTRVTSQVRQVADRGENGASAEAEPKAAGNGFFTASGVNIRTGPATNRTILGQGQKGQRIQVHCIRAGNPSSWWHITNLATGVRGYVYWPDNVLLDYGTRTPPHC